MIQPGEIFLADTPPGQRHRVVVVSREDLNRGKYVIAALITSQKFAVRSTLANCVPLKAGQFGVTQDSVVQGESAGPIRIARLDLTTGPLAKLDDITFRDVIRAIGYVLDSDCEPN
jgi:mRNA-degrading endonuclease toxin of MazEF toxin-antitoxin module